MKKLKNRVDLVKEIGFLSQGEEHEVKFGRWVSVSFAIAWEEGMTATVYDLQLNVETADAVSLARRDWTKFSKVVEKINKFQTRVKRVVDFSDELAKKSKQKRCDFWEDVLKEADKASKDGVIVRFT